jgi:hypothetical protein
MGAFTNLGKNQINRAKYDSKHRPRHKRGRGNQEWGEFVDRPLAYVSNDAMIEMVPIERDIRVSGMQASTSAVEKAEHRENHGIMNGIKRRIILQKHR